MKAIPFVVFVICAGIAGFAASILFGGPSKHPSTSPEEAAFLLVFFGLASLTLPVLIAILNSGKNNR